jgi:predicted kinase
METKLIVVQGQPGVGKTTLARRLSKDLDLPWIGKDVLKEYLFDEIGTGDREWSKMLGRASLRMMYELADEFLASDKNLMIENAFWAQYAPGDIKALLEKNNASALELYCYTDDETRIGRYHTRVKTGERHVGHVEQDGINLDAELRNPRGAEQYGRLGIGEMIEVDTTVLNDQEYQELAQRVEKFLAQD